MQVHQPYFKGSNYRISVDTINSDNVIKKRYVYGYILGLKFGHARFYYHGKLQNFLRGVLSANATKN